MPAIIYVSSDGAEVRIDVPVGKTLKDGALDNEIDGVVAECGGNGLCATCHVYIKDQSALPPLSEIEDELLEGAADERLESSRLGCQITVSDALDGLVVRTPSVQ